MKKILSFIIVMVFTLVGLHPTTVFSQSAPTKQVTKIVKSIEVQGNKTISIATILSKIKTRVGQNYMQSVISDDLKRLYNTGYFSDVRVDREDQAGGFKVIILVDEKPIIEEVTFSKIKALKPKNIVKKMKLQVGKFLDNKALKDDKDTILELYKAKGLTNAEVEVESFIDEVTNKASLHFVVREGFKVRIKNINIFGNDTFKDRKVRKVMKTRKKVVVISRGFLTENTIKEDMERVRIYYEQNGFIDATAEYNVENLVNGWVDINVMINEGKRYSVGKIALSGNDIISDKEVIESMKEIEQDGVFSREKLSVDVSNIRSLYFDRGYIFANVNQTTSIQPGSGEVQVKIDIEEGGVAFIEQVKIQGNTRTRDIVIRRELRMYPGDRFDGTQLRRSKERLNNLGYFEDVSFDIEDTGTDDRKNLVVQVKEAKTGTFSFGGGFSTVDKVVGFVEVEQRNFDLTNWPSFTGGGQHLSLRAETGSSRNNYVLSFTEPWMFDRPISGGFDAYRSQRDRENDTGYAYDETKTGGGLRLGKQFTEYFSGTMNYKLEEVTIENFASGVSSALLAEAGTNVVSLFGLNIKRDTRDSIFSPKKGLIVSSGVDFAGGILGGDKDFYRFTTNASYFHPLTWDSVVEFRVRAGFVESYGDSTSVPIFERFFAGGARTIRGYEERGVGPLDAATQDPVGGESMVVANIEYTVPLIDYIKLAGFIDAGQVWADSNDFGSGDFLTGVGLGLRIKTPIGPINLDYGYPLNDEPGKTDRDGDFYFSVSRGF